MGTVFGALAFTVISFTCVAPFLGGFAGISAAGSARDTLIAVPTSREIFGGLAFATAFAAPFFVLALVPGLLRSLPKSGGWLDSVKVVMGFLELAAALKFLRTAELRVFSPPEYFTYDLVIGAWVAISFACGLYLLNMYRLPHDEERPNIGVPRLLFALAFLGLGTYLLPAMFKGPDGKGQRPAGAVYAWIDAFLLPEPGRKSELEWGTDLKAALDRVRDERLKSGGAAKPVIVDFTGVTCTNCNYNEANIFPQPAVKEQLEKFERVRLYTDEVPAALYAIDPGERDRVLQARANADFERRAFGTSQLPLYVVLYPEVSGLKVRVLGVYPEGKINKPDEIAAFLREAQDQARAKK
jgi:thiol:disulfide interchange protein DsbD